MVRLSFRWFHFQTDQTGQEVAPKLLLAFIAGFDVAQYNVIRSFLAPSRASSLKNYRFLLHADVRGQNEISLIEEQCGIDVSLLSSLPTITAQQARSFMTS
jgi:hypothetical protein